MTKERWDSLKQIFGEALERDPSDREAFVREAAKGDPELLSELLRMLEECDRESGLLNRPALAAAQPLSGTQTVGGGAWSDEGTRFPDSMILARRFSIVRFIARGGMGEVYEAEDLELGERVALKTIRRRMALDSELLGLFKSEIQLARRVTHPNVCRIYDLAQHDDAAAGESTMLLSMELLQGRTLAEHLKRNGPFDWREALPLIEQIGAGIQAAHDAGIIHGDLKPANVMLCPTEDGNRQRAVVMDFGVAIPAASAAQGRARGGTPGYLAPEQADGRPVTPATDVYAFSVLIAEMLGAGWPGKIQWDSRQMPAAWARALKRCSSDDPAGRVQKVSELVALLRPRLRPTWRRPLQAAALVLVAGFGVALARHSWMAENPVLQQLFTEAPGEYVWSVSPDSKLISETLWDTGDLVIRETSTGRIRKVTHSSGERGAWGAIFSPDSRQLVYRWYHNRTSSEVRLVGIDGKGERLLSQSEATPLDWSADSKRILVQYTRDDSLGIISADDGTAQKIPGLGPAAGRALFTPDGKAVVLDVLQPDTKERLFNIHLVSFDGKESSLVDHPANDTLIGWSPDGRRLVFSSDRNGKYSIWAVGVSGQSTTGEPQEIRPGMGELEPLGVTRAGSLYYRLEGRSSIVYTAVLDVGGGRVVSSPKPLPTRFNGPYGYPNWSEDGSRLVFSSEQDVRHPELGIYTLADNSVRMLPVALSVVTRAQWFQHDAYLVATGLSRNGESGHFRIDPQTGEARPISTPQAIQSTFEGVWSPDGSILYDRFDQWKRGIFRLNVATGERRILYVPPDGVDIALENLTLSPDGRTLAFHARNEQAGTADLMLTPTAGGPARTLWTVKRPDGFLYGAFTWTPDSKEILASRTRNEVSEIWRIPVDGSSPARIDFAKLRVTCLRLSHDGKTLAFANAKPRNEIWAFERFLK